MIENVDFACIVENVESVKTLFNHINNAAVLDSLISLKPILEVAKLDEHEALQVAINLDNIITECSKRSDRDHSANSSCHQYVIKALRDEQYRYYVMGGHANGAFDPDPFTFNREDIVDFTTAQQWIKYCDQINYPTAMSMSKTDLAYLRSRLEIFIFKHAPNNRDLHNILSNLTHALTEKGGNNV